MYKKWLPLLDALRNFFYSDSPELTAVIVKQQNIDACGQVKHA